MFSNYLLQHPLIGANGLKAWPHLLPIDNKGYIGPGSPAGGITADHLQPQQPMPWQAWKGGYRGPGTPGGGIQQWPMPQQYPQGPRMRGHGYGPFNNNGVNGESGGPRPLGWPQARPASFAVQQGYGMQRPAQQPMQQRAGLVAQYRPQAYGAVQYR